MLLCSSMTRVMSCKLGSRHLPWFDADMFPQTVASFEESNRMYAIPAETASQGQPFQKENLPGPGK